MIWKWFAIRIRNDAVTGIEPAEAWLQRLQLDNRLPNRAQPLAIVQLERLRPAVITAARKQMQQLQQDYIAAHRPQLERQLAELKALKGRQVLQLDLQLEGSSQAEHFKAARKEERLNRIEKVFADYQTWVQDTHTIEPVPFIQILAVFTRVTD